MDTAQEVYIRVRPVIEQYLKDQLKQFDAFAPAIIEAEFNPASDEAELGVTDWLNPQNVASYLVIIQSVVHLIQMFKKPKQTQDSNAQAEAGTQQKLKDKVPDKAISELITIAKQISTLEK